LNQLPLAIRLRERAVFESFVPGPNLAVVEQLQAMGRGALTGFYWLSGPTGVGKSHLLQASCALARATLGAAAYLSLPQLKQFGAESLEGWQGARIVALDDVAVVAGDATWERALFRLYREAEERATTVLLGAQTPPLAAKFSLPDLASRFTAATLLTLRPLDELAQREALRVRALARGLELPEDTALYLQRRFRRDLSSLYELLDAIDDAALREQRRLTVPFIRQVLAQYPPDDPT
jgi:DnaA-homolog protein